MAVQKYLKIQERFVSVQGEGALVGVPSSFIRVSGCNLRCVWCDTPLTSWTPEGEPVELDELLRWCSEGPRHVVVTGGEPMLFSPTAELTRRLRAVGHHVTIETAGTVWCEEIEADLVSISPKLTHSTPHTRAPSLVDQHERTRINQAVLQRLIASFPWQIKFAVRTQKPIELAEDLVEIDQLLDTLSISCNQRDAVLLIPETIDIEVARAGYAALLEICIKTGMRIGQRFHIELQIQ